MIDTATNERNGLPSTGDEEKSVIGCAIRYEDCAAKLIDKTRPHFFRDPLHRSIMAEAERQWGVDQTFDPLRIGKALRGKVADDIDPVLYLAELGSIDNVPSAACFDSRLAEIIKAARKQQIYGIANEACEAALNGQAPEDIFRTLAAGLDDYRKETAAENPRFPLITASELATAHFALNYLIDRVLVEKQPCILGGPKKALKTTLAILIAIHIALGIDLFGKFRVNGALRVLVASAESGMATIQEIARRICDSLGVQLEDIDNLVFTANVPKPRDPASWAEFRIALEESGAEVLILDPFFRMFDGEGAESIFKMGDVLGIIDDLCQVLGVTLILCHHLRTSRLNQYAPADLDDLAYAGCAEFFRQWLLLSRREAYEPGSGQHRLWLTIGGSAGHNSLWAIDIDEGTVDDPGGRRWATSIHRADEARDNAEQRKADAKAVEAQRQLDDDRAAACRVLAKHKGGLTKTAIGERAGISNRRWPKVFAAMLDNDDLIPVELIVSNHKLPITGYTLNNEAT